MALLIGLLDLKILHEGTLGSVDEELVVKRASFVSGGEGGGSSFGVALRCCEVEIFSQPVPCGEAPIFTCKVGLTEVYGIHQQYKNQYGASLSIPYCDTMCVPNAISDA